MPYRYLEDVATADVAFEAWGASLEELFTAAADATMNVMVEDLATIEKKEERSFQVEDEAVDMLLFKFLQELIFYKDAQLLLLRIQSVTIDRQNAHLSLTATSYGEQLNPEKHSLNVDVKAVTLHRFRVEQTDRGWEASVILDI